MLNLLEELIREAYRIAHEHNKDGHYCHYTYDEAIQYDPLISTLHKALRQFDLEYVLKK